MYFSKTKNHSILTCNWRRKKRALKSLHKLIRRLEDSTGPKYSICEKIFAFLFVFLVMLG